MNTITLKLVFLVLLLEHIVRPREDNTSLFAAAQLCGCSVSQCPLSTVVPAGTEVVLFPNLGPAGAAAVTCSSGAVQSVDGSVFDVYVVTPNIFGRGFDGIAYTANLGPGYTTKTCFNLPGDVGGFINAEGPSTFVYFPGAAKLVVRCNNFALPCRVKYRQPVCSVAATMSDQQIQKQGVVTPFSACRGCVQTRTIFPDPLSTSGQTQSTSCSCRLADSPKWQGVYQWFAGSSPFGDGIPTVAVWQTDNNRVILFSYNATSNQLGPTKAALHFNGPNVGSNTASLEFPAQSRTVTVATLNGVATITYNENIFGSINSYNATRISDAVVKPEGVDTSTSAGTSAVPVVVTVCFLVSSVLLFLFGAM